jgi:hypothetical protein
VVSWNRFSIKKSTHFTKTCCALPIVKRRLRSTICIWCIYTSEDLSSQSSHSSFHKMRADMVAMFQTHIRGMQTSVRHAVCHRRVLGVPQQCSGCAAKRYEVWRHNLLWTPPQCIRYAAKRYEVWRYTLLWTQLQCIRCAAKRHEVWRHNLLWTPLQCIRCAAERYQVWRHNLLWTPPQCIRCAPRIYYEHHHNASGVPPQSITNTATRYQVCPTIYYEQHHNASGVPPQSITNTATMYQVCLHNLLRTPQQCIRCAPKIYYEHRNNVSGVPPHTASDAPPRGIKCVVRLSICTLFIRKKTIHWKKWLNINVIRSEMARCCDGLWTGLPGFDSQKRQRPWVSRANGYRGSSQVVRWERRETDHLLPSSAEIHNVGGVRPPFPARTAACLWKIGVCHRWNRLREHSSLNNQQTRPYTSDYHGHATAAKPL